MSLFQRETRGVRPTDAGQRILRLGRAILDDVDTLIRTAKLRGSAVEGQLCFGVVASFAGGTARILFATFLAAHPEIHLEIVEGSPRDHFAAIRALRMDASLVVGRLPIAGCEVEPPWSEPIFVAVPSSHPIATLREIRWDQLVSERFLVSKMDPGPEIRDFVVQHLADLGRSPLVEPRTVSRESLLNLVGLGLGISLVGAAETAVVYPNVVFQALAGEKLTFSVVWARNNDNPALRRFLSLARQQVQRLQPPATPFSDRTD